MFRRFRHLAFIPGAALLLVMAGCGSNQQSSAGANSPAAPPAPETTRAIQTLDGQRTSVADYRGKVVLVNFWATWCDGCQVEIPWLIDLNQKYAPKGLVILGVDWDEKKDVVEPWVKTKQYQVNGMPELMSYRIGLEGEKIADDFGATIGLPTSVLYSRTGRKVKTIIGADQKELSNGIETQINTPAPATAAPAAAVPPTATATKQG